MIISVTIGGAISFEVAEDGIMERKPRKSSKPLVGKHIMFRTFWVTAVMVRGSLSCAASLEVSGRLFYPLPPAPSQKVVAIIGIYEWSIRALGSDVGKARAAAFTLLVVSSVFYGLNCRSVHEFALGKSLLRPNSAFWISFVGVIGIQALIVHVSGINQFFSCESEEIAAGHCTTMGGTEWGVIFGISIGLMLLVEAEKALSPLVWNPILKPFFEHAFGWMAGPCSRVNCLHHDHETEGNFKFYATSASFHGVPTRVGHGSARTVSDHPIEKAGSRFSTRALAAKAVSARLGLTGPSAIAASSASESVSVTVK